MHSDESAIHIKTFRDIPLGDLDVIFPAQKILFKTVDFVRLGLTAVLGLYFALHAFSELFSDEGVDSTALAACIGECLALFLLLFTSIIIIIFVFVKQVSWRTHRAPTGPFNGASTRTAPCSAKHSTKSRATIIAA